jgi:hypothetical protein
MSDGTRESLTQYELIQILLEEYRTLKAEVQARAGYGFQFGALSVGAIAWVLSRQDIEGGRFLALLAFIILSALAILWIVCIRDVWRIASRLQELEHEVNSRAGAHLLVWERLFAPGARGQVSAVFTGVRPLPRSSLPPLEPPGRS